MTAVVVYESMFGNTRAISEAVARRPARVDRRAAHAPRQVPAATFDTKVRHPRLPGSAARSASRALKAHGFRMVTAPETFDVDGTTGPSLSGETDRAASWGAALAAYVNGAG